MPYPDSLPTPALDRATGARADVAPRELSAWELEFKARVRAVVEAVDALRRAPLVFERDSHGDDALQSLLTDAPVYCATLLEAVEALPEEEAAAEDARIDQEKWG